MKKPRRPKLKKGAWYYKVRGSYLPATWQGWLTYIPFTAFLLAVLVMALETQHTVAGVLYMVFPEWVAATVVMTWIAKQKS